jgi:hypothetical protein
VVVEYYFDTGLKRAGSVFFQRTSLDLNFSRTMTVLTIPFSYISYLYSGDVRCKDICICASRKYTLRPESFGADRELKEETQDLAPNISYLSILRQLPQLNNAVLSTTGRNLSEYKPSFLYT